MKLYLIIGKNIHELVDGQHGLKYKTPCTFFYPELRNGRNGFVYPLHADDYVLQTLKRVIDHFENDGRDAMIFTQSQDLANSIGLYVNAGKLKGGIDNVEVRLYADDNQSYKVFTYDEEGRLSPDWPFGWFLLNDYGHY